MTLAICQVLRECPARSIWPVRSQSRCSCCGPEAAVGAGRCHALRAIN